MGYMHREGVFPTIWGILQGVVLFLKGIEPEEHIMVWCRCCLREELRCRQGRSSWWLWHARSCATPRCVPNW